MLFFLKKLRQSVVFLILRQYDFLSEFQSNLTKRKKKSKFHFLFYKKVAQCFLKYLALSAKKTQAISSFPHPAIV